MIHCTLKFAPLQLLVCIWMCCLGCSKEVSTAPVSGKITYQGQPLVGANITTQPIAVGSANPGSGSFGRTDEQGQYELELVTPAKKGAIIGDHRVMITPANGEPPSNLSSKTEDGIEIWSDNPSANRAGKASAKWPALFTDGSLQLTVPSEGTSEANFDLTHSSKAK